MTLQGNSRAVLFAIHAYPESRPTIRVSAMKIAILLTLAAPFAALPVHDLVAKHEKGQVRRTTFSTEESREMTEMSSVMNGEEHAMPDMVHEESRSLAGVFVDTCLSTDSGELTGFSREYTDLAGGMSIEIDNPFGEGISEDAAGDSDLNDLTVVFALEDDGFEAKFPDDQGGDEDLLDGLTALFPWSQYLPEEAVEEDSEWELAPTLLGDTLDLGGDLGITFDEDSPFFGDDESNNEFEPDVTYDGSFTATLSGTEEVDGRTLAEITLEIDISEFADQTESMQAEVGTPPDDLPDGMMQPDIESMTVETLYEGEGTLIWDIKGGYLVSLDLELTTESTQVMSMSMDLGGEVMEMEQVMVFSGQQVFSAEVEVE